LNIAPLRGKRPAFLQLFLGEQRKRVNKLGQIAIGQWIAPARELYEQTSTRRQAFSSLARVK
jgi:hypothetical protein